MDKNEGGKQRARSPEGPPQAARGEINEKKEEKNEKGESETGERQLISTGGKRGRKALIICRFYLAGKCKMGKECDYYHQGDATEVFKEEAEVTDENDKTAEKKVKAEEDKLAKEETDDEYDGEKPWRRDQEQRGESEKEQERWKNYRCKFFLKGRCQRGENCLYRHDTQPGKMEQGGRGENQEGGWRKGDWECAECHRQVFRWRQECLCGCRKEAPAPEEKESERDYSSGPELEPAEEEEADAHVLVMEYYDKELEVWKEKTEQAEYKAEKRKIGREKAERERDEANKRARKAEEQLKKVEKEKEKAQAKAKEEEKEKEKAQKRRKKRRK